MSESLARCPEHSGTERAALTASQRRLLRRIAQVSGGFGYRPTVRGERAAGELVDLGLVAWNPPGGTGLGFFITPKGRAALHAKG